ncbi:hypothetical protein UFOVP916_24 [uncultured Caudovirales phage]|uniref:Uncharacterized protein n=1 Tax=uncultured Caudovirales phage TaxID=2100421 RepID=A0A6J5P888_9CAUD|nr:hypothetical protein UFOVP827_45 [uncultured Caudovirales phage]CAB4171453.1 hypothetical protein UFOVP916_24 [uncultured Caudovirales phage]CAB4177434.1 hypothetical protein UFOVP1001_48 [uncultured Caudovirales phage]CAB4199229.1 hypothetical protein UFOVP1338_28 [uncultured Caudovirales phage]CAB4213402.1 hypothetical protein UFOVP1447_23 [uncultured Caudovirales phage]
MKKETVSIIYEGLSLTIVGGYSPAEPMSADRTEPPVKEEFEIYEFIYIGLNTTALLNAILSDEQRNEIEILCLEKLK